MLKYTVKRLLYSALILLFVMFLIYVLMTSLPMGYIEQKAQALASQKGGTKSYDEWLKELNAQYGMDKDKVTGYFTWLGNAARGQWGESWKWNVQVTEKFHDTVWYSFILGLISFVFCRNLVKIHLCPEARLVRHFRYDQREGWGQFD